MPESIPNDEALKLCKEIRKENLGKWYYFYGTWCTMCDKVSKGDVSKLCFYDCPDNRGCSKVNNRWDKRTPTQREYGYALVVNQLFLKGMAHNILVAVLATK